MIDSGLHPTAGPASETLILVEPNDDDRSIYRALFAFLGLGVVCADEVGAAEEVASVVRSVRPAVIVLALDGVALGHVMDASAAGLPRLLYSLKNDPVTLDIPLLVLTTHVAPAFREELRHAGADEVVLKPAALSSVSIAVTSLLRGAARTRCAERAATLRH